MAFDYAAHARSLTADPVIDARRRANLRKALVVQWTPEMDAKLAELCRMGLGATPIGNAIGVGKALVRRRRDQLGLPKGFRRLPRTMRKGVRGVVFTRVI